MLCALTVLRRWPSAKQPPQPQQQAQMTCSQRLTWLRHPPAFLRQLSPQLLRYAASQATGPLADFSALSCLCLTTLEVHFWALQ